MIEKSYLWIKIMWEQVREVNVVIFWDKARNPFRGMVEWLERSNDLRFKGKKEI
jgi:hypothetical protein